MPSRRRVRSVTPPTRVDEPGYPRPQLERDQWISLNGRWQFYLDRDGRRQNPAEVQFTDSIVVPFSPETPASGIGNTDLFKSCWYRRTVDVPAFSGDEHVLLHFGAVDYRATVWVNDYLARRHDGG